MEKIRVEVSAARGKGATTVAILIGRLLQQHGFTISYKPPAGRGSMAARQIQESIDSTFPLDLSQPRRIQLVDLGAKE
jgi:hypothetical protein